MSATVIPAHPTQARKAEERREPTEPRNLRLAGRCVLVALALVLAWLLVCAELTREDATDCHHRGYRDPVTGRQMERSCRAM